MKKRGGERQAIKGWCDTKDSSVLDKINEYFNGLPTKCVTDDIEFYDKITKYLGEELEAVKSEDFNKEHFKSGYNYSLHNCFNLTITHMTNAINPSNGMRGFTEENTKKCIGYAQRYHLIESDEVKKFNKAVQECFPNQFDPITTNHPDANHQAHNQPQQTPVQQPPAQSSSSRSFTPQQSPPKITQVQYQGALSTVTNYNPKTKEQNDMYNTLFTCHEYLCQDMRYIESGSQYYDKATLYLSGMESNQYSTTIANGLVIQMTNNIQFCETSVHTVELYKEYVTRIKKHVKDQILKDFNDELDGHDKYNEVPYIDIPRKVQQDNGRPAKQEDPTSLHQNPNQQTFHNPFPDTPQQPSHGHTQPTTPTALQNPIQQSPTIPDGHVPVPVQDNKRTKKGAVAGAAISLVVGGAIAGCLFGIKPNLASTQAIVITCVTIAICTAIAAGIGAMVGGKYTPKEVSSNIKEVTCNAFNKTQEKT